MQDGQLDAVSGPQPGCGASRTGEDRHRPGGRAQVRRCPRPARAVEGPRLRSRAGTGAAVGAAPSCPRTMHGRLPRGRGIVWPWHAVGRGRACGVRSAPRWPRARMTSAGVRDPIDGARSVSLGSERGVPCAVSPSVCHHLTSGRRHDRGKMRLTLSWPACGGRRGPSGRGGPATRAVPDRRPEHPRHAVGQRDGDGLDGVSLNA